MVIAIHKYALRVFGFIGLLVSGILFGGCTEVEVIPMTVAVEQVDSTVVVVEKETAPVKEATLLLHNAHPLPISKFKEEMLWLARCIYAETKRTDEQFLIAWVIRNRVETRYRKKTTYKRVILDPYQFSAFNPGAYSRRYYAGLDAFYSEPAWQNALWVARRVLLADAKDRPFSVTTRHFYSERSMTGELKAPTWSENKSPIKIKGFQIDARRFRFYDKVI